MSVSGCSQCLEMRTLSIIFAQSGRIAATMWILALPSFRSLWLFPMSGHSFCTNCWLCASASKDLMRPLTVRLLMNAPKVSWMRCSIHYMRFLIAGLTIPEASRVDCCSRVMKLAEEALSVIIRSKWLLVSSKQSRTSFKCTASLAPVCWPLT